MLKMNDSTQENPAAPTGATPNSTLKWLALHALGTFILIVLPLGILTIYKGQGETVEFCPEQLEFRCREVTYIPIFDIPIHSRVVERWPHPLRDMWEEKEYLTKSDPEIHWDLVRYWTPGSAARTTSLTDLTDTKVVAPPEVCKQWTDDNPEKAAEFWPEVISLIQARKYDESIAFRSKGPR